MTQLGRLEAAIKILDEQNQAMRERAESDHRQIRALTRDVSVLVQAMETLIEMTPRIELVLARAEYPELLRGPKMARRIGISEDELRRRAERGEIPGYQPREQAHWFYDPVEVVQAIKDTSRRRLSAIEQHGAAV